MKKIVVSGVLCAFAVFGGVGVASAAEATTTSATPKTQSEMLAQIQSLMKLIADLQAKLAQVKGEVQELTKDLALGAKDDDVLKAQEILASDPALFGVKPTGYFGPMTEAALKKFQERYGLEVTGKLDQATRDVMKELRKERKDGMVPPGLIKSDEVKDRIKARLQDRWDKKHSDDDMDDDSDESDTASVTREEARGALADTQAEVAAYRADVVKISDKEDKKDGLETLREAQKKMTEARKKFARMKFSEVMEITNEVSSLLDGSDSSSNDDMDDDEDESDDDMDDDDEDDDSDEDESNDDEDDD